MATLQFVNSIADSPTVLLDLNSASSGLQVSQGWDFSPAKFDKGWATSPLRHGARNTRAAAQNIVLTIPLEIVADTDSAAATAIENLGRMLAVNNILKVQVGSPNPVFYRTFGNPDYAMAARNNLLRDTRIELQIDAEPFAYGPRVEVTGSPFTLSNDPANGCFIDIASVQGDVPTPLLLQATSTGTGGLASKWTHVATRRRGTPSNIINTIQAESMTNGTDASDVVDASFSNGSKVRVSFATAATNQLRVNNRFPRDGTVQEDARGEYRVYGRFAKTVPGDTITVQLGYGTASATAIKNDAVTLPSASGPYWVDLGKVPVPLWSDPVQRGFSGVDSSVDLPFVGVWAARTAGSGSLDIDCIYFMPADESTVIVKWPADDETYVLDGTTPDGGSGYAMNTSLSTIRATSTAAQIVAGGGFPELIPGQTNRIHIIRQVDPAGTVDSIANTTTLRAYYWPRWREYSRT